MQAKKNEAQKKTKKTVHESVTHLLSTVNNKKMIIKAWSLSLVAMMRFA